MKDLKHMAAKKRGTKQQAKLNVDGMEEQIRQFDGKSEEELTTELMDAVSKGKQDGSFNKESLDAFLANVSPMLSDSQRQKIQELSKKLL